MIPNLKIFIKKQANNFHKNNCGNIKHLLTLLFEPLAEAMLASIFNYNGKATFDDLLNSHGLSRKYFMDEIKKDIHFKDIAFKKDLKKHQGPSYMIIGAISIVTSSLVTLLAIFLKEFRKKDRGKDKRQFY